MDDHDDDDDDDDDDGNDSGWHLRDFIWQGWWPQFAETKTKLVRFMFKVLRFFATS